MADIDLGNIIQQLNANNNSRVFEVTSLDDTLLIGDGQLCKGDLDSWDQNITGLKPGIWRSSSESVIDSNIVFSWVSAGNVDYTSLQGAISAQGGEEGVGEWEALGSWSADSGGSAAVMKSTLLNESIIDDHESALEIFLDAMLFGEVPGVGDGPIAVPGGIVWSANEGGDLIFARKNQEGAYVKIKIKGAEAEDEEEE